MILVVHSPYTYPEKQFFVPIDQTFIEGNSPWQDNYLSPTDSQNWHPVLKYQERQIENICETGPYTAKTTTNSIEAHCYYRFYFKWGGCTTNIQNITDPGDLPHYTVPNNFIQGPQIQDPSEDPKNEIWDFDIRRHFITDSAATRIKQTINLQKLLSQVQHYQQNQQQTKHYKHSTKRRHRKKRKRHQSSSSSSSETTATNSDNNSDSS